jgi:glyoxylase-like metal-dependent hydrolase (beta-lactamase superfamily II)
MSKSVQITSAVYQVGGGPLSAPEDAAIYLIKENDEGILIDAGCGNATDRVMENIRSCNLDPDRISMLLLTHCHYDHTGGAQEIRQRTGCKLVAHELDAVYLENGDDEVTAANWYGDSLHGFQVDRKLTDDRDTINLGELTISALHTPGHTPGSVVYLLESENKSILFGQDVHGPLNPAFKSNHQAYQRSLKKMLDLNADILCEGHFGIIKGRRQVADFISGYLI